MNLTWSYYFLFHKNDFSHKRQEVYDCKLKIEKMITGRALKYCKTRFFRVPFISRISRARQIRENNGHAKIR